MTTEFYQCALTQKGASNLSLGDRMDADPGITTDDRLDHSTLGADDLRAMRPQAHSTNAIPGRLLPLGVRALHPPGLGVCTKPSIGCAAWQRSAEASG
jgi:hypothetical protein